VTVTSGLREGDLDWKEEEEIGRFTIKAISENTQILKKTSSVFFMASVYFWLFCFLYGPSVYFGFFVFFMALVFSSCSPNVYFSKFLKPYYLS
jgi:hypothetical protein